ncbi:MAG: 1-acyl-sn-glycerol-3-phosphate acyltransferase [Ichthyobacteriaceae bacterium]|nr:1-acyl-sn-glycerol-3-phosphate acyltransferase [Ichthyobacteriaceae bacterium]
MNNLSKYDDIRPSTDEEAREIFKYLSKHPIVQSIMKLFNPTLSKEELVEYIASIKDVEDFQAKFSYLGMKYIKDITSDGLTYEGLDGLKPENGYLFISTHRDILLDAGFLNYLFYEHGLNLAEQAIGDNLISKNFISQLSKVNRNFIVKRDAPVREMVANSRHLSEYIQLTLHEKNWNVWIAQREGRTKDGLDKTNPGLLKMLTLAADRKGNMVEYLKKQKIVPMAVSYENDPNDRFKIDELIAKENAIPYAKAKDEDFQHILMGIIGKKKRMHLALGAPLDKELDELEGLAGNKLLQRLADILDKEIVRNYKLWPSNFIAYDILNKTDKYKSKYNKLEEKSFLRRLERRAVQHVHFDAERKFLEMYANPIVNKMNFNLLD